MKLKQLFELLLLLTPDYLIILSTRFWILKKQLLKILKIRRMRILSARFSNSFGGKIGGSWKAVTMATVKTRNLRIVECNKYLNDYTLCSKSFNKEAKYNVFMK